MSSRKEKCSPQRQPKMMLSNAIAPARLAICSVKGSFRKRKEGRKRRRKGK
jgi:hypothetical protein